jgi:hypothetical protein
LSLACDVASAISPMEDGKNIAKKLISVWEPTPSFLFHAVFVQITCSIFNT